jgi:hypothetical protein
MLFLMELKSNFCPAWSIQKNSRLVSPKDQKRKQAFQEVEESLAKNKYA